MKEENFIVQPSTRRQELIEKQLQICADNGNMWFAVGPGDKSGVCYSCKKNNVTEEWATRLITGCRLCHRSYCD